MLLPPRVRPRFCLLATAAVAALVLCAAPTTAQQEAPAEMLQDPAGDVVLRSPAGDQPPPDGSDEPWDLRSLRIHEDSERLGFEVGVAALDPADAPSGFGGYVIAFQRGDVPYQVVIRRPVGDEGAETARAYLAQGDGERWFYLEGATATADRDAQSWSVPFARSLLLDGSGAPPAPGLPLKGMHVMAAGADYASRDIDVMGNTVVGSYLHDRMPDGDGLGTFDPALGVRQTGHVRLHSPEPFRASNGAETTIVYEVHAENLGSEDDTLELVLAGAPAAWEVQLPTSRLEVGARESIVLPVVVHTPFGHQHGGTASFIMEAHSASDPAAVGRIEIGVRYLKVPQPAGHHDTVHVHSFDLSDDPAMLVLGTALGEGLGAGGVLQEDFMNTLEVDERADEVPIEGSYCRFGVAETDYPVKSGYCWSVPLEAGLLLGLDMDLEREGEATLTIETSLPLPQAYVEGRLLYYPPPEDGEDRPFWLRESVEIATLGPSEAKDIGPAGRATFTTNITALPEGDLVPYQRGGLLDLELSVLTLRPENLFFGPRQEPFLLPGASFRLPLNEYADPVSQAFGTGGGVALVPLEGQERPVNPGRTVVFPVDLRNDANGTETFRLSVLGQNHGWAHLDGKDRVELGPGEKVQVRVAVAVPQDAAEGERADLVLEAASLENVERRGLLRLVARVVVAEDVPDESGRVQREGGRDAPGPSWPAALAAVALAAVATRRR